MTYPIQESGIGSSRPRALPRGCPEVGRLDLPPRLLGSDHEKTVFESAVSWPARPQEPEAKPAVLPEALPDLRPEDQGEDLIPDWPAVSPVKLRGRALLASVGIHLALLLTALGLAYLSPPEVDFELAAGSPYLEVDMVEIARLGGGEELAPDEAAAPERWEQEAAPAEAEAEAEPEMLAKLEPAPEPEIAPAPEIDLKPVEEPKKEAPKPKKAAAEKPKKAKPERATGNPEVGGKAGAGPGSTLGSAHGNSAVGGGGAGGKKNSGKPGWVVARRPEPRYPAASKQNGEQGRVVVTVTVTPAGKIGGASVSQPSGHARLDQAALSAAKGIVFKPGKGGAPSGTVTVRVPYQFNLRR